MLKHDVDLFSRLYIFMPHREGDMGTIFGHENHLILLYLTGGSCDQERNLDLLSILAQETESSEHFTSFDVDGAAIVHKQNDLCSGDLLLPKFFPSIFRKHKSLLHIDHSTNDIKIKLQRILMAISTMTYAQVTCYLPLPIDHYVRSLLHITTLTLNVGV
jgi:hypothetical protein